MARGTSTRQIRIDTPLWDAFGEAVRRADPEIDRSAILRMVARWVTADPQGAIKTIREHLETAEAK